MAVWILRTAAAAAARLGRLAVVPLLDFFDDGPRTVERKRRRSLAGKVVDYPLDVA